MMKIEIALAADGSDWWDELDKDQQQEYIKKHPNSKYAKQVKNKDAEAPKKDEKSKEKSKDKKGSKAKKVAGKLRKNWDNFSKEQKEFFERGGHKPGSKERRTFGKFMKDKAKGVAKAVKHEVKEWKEAGAAIKKIATGKEISDHEKKALKSVAIHAAMVVGPMAISGGLSAGMTAAAKGIGMGLLEHTALIRGAQIAVFASKNDFDDMSESDALTRLIEQMGDAMVDAPITDAQWAASALKK